jgi:DNA-binding LacI/PurR family transcriptional regulator
VQAAVEALRYVPNRMARSLVTRRTDTIALVLSESNTQVFSDPFFASIVRGLSARLADTDLNLVLLAARDRREQEKIGRYVRQGHARRPARLLRRR